MSTPGEASPFAAIWPSGPISEQQWRERVEDLAREAEGLIGKKEATLQQLCRLAMIWAGLSWAAMSPELIALSCRASLLPGVGPPGVVVAEGLPDQLDEIRDRLDSIFEAAQADPSALVVEAHPPVIIRPPTPRDPYKVRQPRKPKPPAALEEPAALELPEDWGLDEPAPLELPEPLEEPAPLELPEPLEEPEPLELPKGWNVEEPAAAELPDTIPSRSEWFDQEELGQLLEKSVSTIRRWRGLGRLGAEGIDWYRRGRKHFYAPQLAEVLLRQTQGRAAPKQSPPVPPADPERWVGSVELGAWFGLSGPWITQARRLGWLTQGIHYRKALPGELPKGHVQAGAWIHDLRPCLLALAEASGRPVPAEPINDPAKARQAAKIATRKRGKTFRAGLQCLQEEQQKNPPPLGGDWESVWA